MEQDNQLQIDARNSVQCAMTGKWIPREDSVNFHGFTLSAAGKEMLFEIIRSGELFPGEMEIPPVSKRIMCYIVDMFLLGAVSLIIILVIFKFHQMPNSPIEYLSNAVAGLLAFVLEVAYFTLMHGYTGQSLGKMGGMIKVVNMDGSAITLRTAFFRTLYMIAPLLIPTFGMFAGATGLTVGNNVMIILQLISSLYLIADAMFALLDKSMQRSLHDRLAKTRVIMA